MEQPRSTSCTKDWQKRNTVKLLLLLQTEYIYTVYTFDTEGLRLVVAKAGSVESANYVFDEEA